MRIFKAITMMLCAAVLCAVMATNARADLANKETIVTFDNPVQIPGQVLEPGTYVFKLADTVDRNVVQIYMRDTHQIVATVLTVPEYQLNPMDQSAFFLNRSGREQQLQSWFYAGETSGQQFLYPGMSATTQEATNRIVYGQ